MAVNTLKRSNSSQELDLAEICGIPEEYSLDIACGKPVLEQCNHPEELTKSVFDGYDGQSGYCGVHCPTYLTIDLKRNFDIGLIQFLLFDSVVDPNRRENERKFYFRVLVAGDYAGQKAPDKDSIVWQVIYDSGHNGFRNWQLFKLDGVSARFIRIHCIRNSSGSSGFQIVRLRAYSPEAASYVDFAKVRDHIKEHDIDPCGLSQLLEIKKNSIIEEMGDGFPVSKRIYDLSSQFRQLCEANKISPVIQGDYPKSSLSSINPIVMDNIYSREGGGHGSKVNLKTADFCRILDSIAEDFAIIERNSDGTRRIVLDPVCVKLKNGNTWGIISIVLTVLFFLLPKLLS